MIQEILNNIIRHAREICYCGHRKSAMQTLIEVRDDGSGFDVEKLKSTETGIGLKVFSRDVRLSMPLLLSIQNRWGLPSGYN